MTSRQAKAELKNCTLLVRPGRPPFPKEWKGKPLTEFQRDRLKKTVPVMKLFLLDRNTVKEIGAKLGVTYQRVEQILKVGLAWYETVGWLLPATPMTLAGETVAIEAPPAARPLRTPPGRS
jgi:hypothetical protein